MTQSSGPQRLRESSAVRRAALSCVAISTLWGASARAQSADSIPTLNFYGSPGLLDMPSARMSPDGSFNIWAAGTGFTQRYGFSFQAMPWFEGSFRDIGTKNLFNAGQVFSGGTYYDRSFGVRIRLQNETDGWPDITVGVNDVIGTGLEGAEYLVASKRLGYLDVSLGMGWGRLASTAMFENPFALILPSFAFRSSPTGTRSHVRSSRPHAAFSWSQRVAVRRRRMGDADRGTDGVGRIQFQTLIGWNPSNMCFRR